MLIRLMFKETPKICEDISSDLQTLSQYLRSKNSSSKDLEHLQTTRPELWVSPMLLRIFSSTSLDSPSSLSNFLSGLDLIQVLLNSTEKFEFIFEILFSTNGIFKNTLRVIQEIQARGSFSSLQVVLKSSLKFLERVSRFRFPETFYMPQVFDVILSFCQKLWPIEKKLQQISFKILKNLAVDHYLLYLESNGPEICVNILTEVLNNQASLEVCKVLLELVVGTLIFPETIKCIQGSSFIDALKPVAIRGTYDLYPSMLNCLDLLINENSLFISEIIQSHLAIHLFESFEVSVPPKLHLIEPLARFLALICSNFEGLQIVSRFSVLTRVIEALIRSDEDLCNDFGVSIGENLKKIVGCIPYAVSKCVEGCLNVLSAWKESPNLAVPGIGKVFKYCFCFTLDVVFEFFNQVYFKDLLEVIRKSVYLQASQLSWIFCKVKKLPESLLSGLMIKTIHSLCFNFYKLQQMTGTLDLDLQSFETLQVSQYFPYFQELNSVQALPDLKQTYNDSDVQEVLVFIEIHLDSLKLMVDASKSPSLHYQELSNCLINLGYLAKICINESVKLNGNQSDSKSKQVTRNSSSSTIYCSLTEKIISFFSTCAHSCCTKPEKNLLENSAFCILKNLGEILASLLREVEISDKDLFNNQVSSQVVSFVRNVIFSPKTFTTSLLYSFYSALGMQNVYRLLADIKNWFRNHDDAGGMFKLLWKTNLDILKSLVKSADQMNSKGQLLLMSLGCSDAEAFIKELKIEALFYFKHNNFDQATWFKIEFKKTELEVFEYFLDHFEEFFEEDQEKTEHFYLHIDNRVKNCRNLIFHQGFFIKLEEIVEEIFEFSVKTDKIYKKSCEILMKISKTCQFMQKTILESLNNELQICLFELDEGQLVLNKVHHLLAAVYLQQKTCSDFLVTFEKDAFSLLKLLLEKIEKKPENIQIFELVFQIITQSFDRNPDICDRLAESLAKFCKSLDFQINQFFFQVIFEFLAKISENVETIEKFSKFEFFQSVIKLQKTSEVGDKGKEFSGILMKFYENKSVLKNFYRKEFEAFLKNQKISLQHFLSYFSESLLKHKDIFLNVVYENCFLDTIFVHFSQVPAESLQSEKILTQTFQCLYEVDPIVKTLGIVQSLIQVLKKHPSASVEIFSFFTCKNFDFFRQIVSKRLEFGTENSDSGISNEFLFDSESVNWLKTCMIFLKLLIIQKNEDFNSKVFEELELLFTSSLIIDDLVTSQVSNYFLQQFLQSHELKDLLFYRDLLSLYTPIGVQLTKINLKLKNSNIFFNTLLESFELLKSSSVALNELDSCEEEIVENSESFEETEFRHPQVVETDENSEESSEQDESDSKDSESYSEPSSSDSFRASLQESSFRKLEMIQRAELEVLEFFSNESQPLVPRSCEEQETHKIRIQKMEKEVNLCLSPQLSKQVFQVLVKSLSSIQHLNEKIAALVFLQYLQNDYIWKNVVTALAELLVVDSFETSLTGKAEHAYCNLSIRVLDILNHMVSLSLSAALILVGKSAGFVILIRLFQNPLFQNSYFHLSALVKLFLALTSKLGTQFPALTEQVLSSITSLLASPVLPDSATTLLTSLLAQFSRLPANRSTTLTCVTDSLRKLVDVPNLLPSIGLNIQKQLRILQLCKLLKSLGGCVETIDHLWESLSEVLLSSGPKSSLIPFIPIIEAFFVCHEDRASSASFKLFSLKTQKQLNSLIKQHPSLLLSNFKCLVSRFPSLLDFENKRNYFRAEMRKVQQDAGHDVIRLHVRRQEVFMDSYHQLKDRDPEELCCKIRIQFVGEEGLDAGGLTREWYSLLARAMFNANSALFIPSANGVSFQPNSMSLTNKEHIEFFKFVGRIIGKALFDGHPLDLYFTRSFYKHILGQEVNYQDMEDLDLDFYKSLKSLMDINLNESELHEYYFAYEEEEFGIHKIKELVPGGRTKRVTEENKIDYIKLLCHMKMTKNIQAQIDAFKSGFQELIPVQLVSIFGSKELELLISGLPEVDLEDLKNNTDYHNYTHESQVIIWLWEVLYEFSHEERAEFIQFVTGSSKVPLEGFKALPGLGGTQKFQIHKSFTSDDRLPTAHTCMNQLDLPEYQSKEKLKNRLKIAISEGKEGFGFI